MDTLTTSLRLLANNIDCDDGVAIAVVLQAADEIERLREAIRRLADQDATLSVQGGNVTVTVDATLTDAEREALERAIETLDGWQKTGGYHSAIEDDADALRGLLSRLGDCPTPDNEADRDSGTTGSE